MLLAPIYSAVRLHVVGLAVDVWCTCKGLSATLHTPAPWWIPQREETRCKPKSIVPQPHRMCGNTISTTCLMQAQLVPCTLSTTVNNFQVLFQANICPQTGHILSNQQEILTHVPFSYELWSLPLHIQHHLPLLLDLAGPPKILQHGIASISWHERLGASVNTFLPNPTCRHYCQSNPQ